MKKPRYNPYKYSTIVLFIIVVTFFAFSDDWTVPYYILSGSGVVFLGILTTNFMVADKNILTWIGSFLLYTFISSMTLGPILYLVIPHFADELLFANIMTIKDGSYQSKHTLIWNGPIDGVVLSKGQNYIYNDTDKPIYLIAATYTPTHSRRPFFDNFGTGIQLKETIKSHELIKNNYKIFSYLEIPPDTITEKMRHPEFSSSKTYFFVVSQKQYIDLFGYDTTEYESYDSGIYNFNY